MKKIKTTEINSDDKFGLKRTKFGAIILVSPTEFVCLVRPSDF